MASARKGFTRPRIATPEAAGEVRQPDGGESQHAEAEQGEGDGDRVNDRFVSAHCEVVAGAKRGCRGFC